MPPALHPRSNFTTSLFGTTLALCFLVVGLPHIIPCPVPHTPQFAEGQMEIIGADGRRYRRRLAPKTQQAQIQAQTQDLQDIRHDSEVNMQKLARESQEDEEELRRKSRECPVPKPAGMVGRILGFKQEEERARPVVRIEDGLRIARREDGKGGG